MKKFSRIFESKDDLITKLGSSEEEIKDMCSELVDEGYKLTISTEYLGLNSKIYSKPNQTLKYYPSIEIDLHRDIRGEKDQYGDSDTRAEFKDVRIWNGGVFYEGNIALLKSIYEICYRFESTFTSDKAKVYFSMRSINEVRIRITFGVEESTSAVDFSKVKSYVEGTGYDNFNDELYKIADNVSYGDGSRYKLVVKAKGEAMKKITDDVINSNKANNVDHLKVLFEKYVESVFSLCQKQNPRIRYTAGGDWTMIKTELGENLVKLEMEINEEGRREFTTSKSLFRKETKKIHYYSMEINITLYN